MGEAELDALDDAEELDEPDELGGAVGALRNMESDNNSNNARLFWQIESKTPLVVPRSSIGQLRLAQFIVF